MKNEKEKKEKMKNEKWKNEKMKNEKNKWKSHKNRKSKIVIFIPIYIYSLSTFFFISLLISSM